MLGPTAHFAYQRDGGSQVIGLIYKLVGKVQATLSLHSAECGEAAGKLGRLYVHVSKYLVLLQVCSHRSPLV